ncbi:hypothetical protein FA13DRAFT_1733010 [Coprinellus micaceus]|uniref:Uncharacterized protein n=1 Tax=Coprinellus micaceus TaxID=71717 RepID=A0A4Y7TA94_COPMI|nr:hypothetical protein FA13DRAFT_1733010 [Coprinellus micaceus]
MARRYCIFATYYWGIQQCGVDARAVLGSSQFAFDEPPEWLESGDGVGERWGEAGIDKQEMPS